MQYQGWESYWQSGNRDQALIADANVQSFIDQYWVLQLQAAIHGHTIGTALELGCGAGSLAPTIKHYLHGSVVGPLTVYLDISHSALARLNTVHASAALVQADMARLPFRNDSIDLILSQFGIEYAGTQAFCDSAGLLTSNGILIALCHHQDGCLVDRAKQAQRLLTEIVSCGMLPAAHFALTTLFDCIEGRQAHARFVEADTLLSPKVQAVGLLVRQHSHERLVIPWLSKFCRDFAAIYHHPQNYPRSASMVWLDNMIRELPAYLDRMQQLITASLSNTCIELIQSRLGQAGFAFQAEPLSVKGQLFAWSLRILRL
ncbi:class I SAM-dependent methyltransferase [Bowmanella dokdonensis]|uniref:Class I SAM-dependent methyltransferase n=1 Tax=Bowmanella dokdonensis TaxID=751969 RepID=A0A939DRH9_9ALTE|nr:class I SAM-dependent methyltransferase [Bowmanella dokdonensis]MBN7826556.1 class I SAM-dependent methyltransferase [Bowmanella dokdonensis]